MFRPIAITLEMIKFQHTVFALPFAFLAAFTAAGGVPPASKVMWILVAMIAARSAAMAFNRLVDSEFDARNQRTAGRAIPAGLISHRFVLTFTAVSVVMFLVAAFKLNRLALWLSPVALFIILGYSYTKRFTSLSHLILGIALAIAPIGAWVAIRAELSARVVPLALAVACWTAGFDILYSMQDVEFDRKAGLFSIPSKLGASRALVISRFLHAATLFWLGLFGWVNGFGILYFAGVAAAAGLLLWQHSIISADDLSRINAAFFTANGVLSIVLFVSGACDILL